MLSFLLRLSLSPVFSLFISGVRWFWIPCVGLRTFGEQLVYSFWVELEALNTEGSCYQHNNLQNHHGIQCAVPTVPSTAT